MVALLLKRTFGPLHSDKDLKNFRYGSVHKLEDRFGGSLPGEVLT